MYRRLLNIERPSGRLTCLPVNYASPTLSYFPTRSQILRVDLSTVRVSSRFVIEVQQGYTHYRIVFLKFTVRCSKAIIAHAMHLLTQCIRSHIVKICDTTNRSVSSAFLKNAFTVGRKLPSGIKTLQLVALRTLQATRFSSPLSPVTHCRPSSGGTSAIHFCSPSHERCSGAALHAHKVNVARKKNRHNPERHECERQLGHLDHRVGPRNR